MLGPTSKYQEAFYTFEEIKGMSGARSESAMNGVGVAQAALGRWSESGSAIEEGLALVRFRLFHFSTSSAARMGGY